MKNYFLILKISENSSIDDIKKSYRKLAKEFHPDRCLGDNQAIEKFRLIQEAFDFLMDDRKRNALLKEINNKKTKDNEIKYYKQKEDIFIDVFKRYYVDEDIPIIR